MGMIDDFVRDWKYNQRAQAIGREILELAGDISRVTVLSEEQVVETLVNSCRNTRDSVEADVRRRRGEEMLRRAKG